jgi:Cof subfamily protein (haloacid dehalogenase superfamily)
MTTYRLVASDLDGTLLDLSGAVTERTRLVAGALRDAGVVLALATSRRHTGALPIAEALHLDGPLILYDGAQVREHPGGTVVMDDTLESSVAQEACAVLVRHDLRPIVQYGSEAGEWLRIGSPPRIQTYDATYLAHFASQVTEVPLDLLCYGEPCPLRVVAFGPRRRLLRAAAELATLPCATQILPNGNYNAAELTIFSSTASKGHALLRLAERLGIPRELTFAIGDGLNDISLLRAAGMSVAMGNACAEVRAAARHIAAAHDADGAAEAIERHVLGRSGVQTVAARHAVRTIGE